jgi:hypothetical protein
MSSTAFGISGPPLWPPREFGQSTAALPIDPQSAAITPSPAPGPNGKWQTNFGVSEFDDAESVTLSLRAETLGFQNGLTKQQCSNS